MCSYNCRGLPKNEGSLQLKCDILTLLKEQHVICLQETWYCKQENVLLNTVFDGFHGTGEAVIDSSAGIHIGRPHSGVAILWHSTLDSCVTSLNLGCDWMTGVKIIFQNKVICILNVYMPVENSDNEDEFLYRLGYLSSKIDELDTSSFCVLGDFNANISKTPTSLFANHLTEYCSNNNLLMSSKIKLPADSFTFISNWGTTSWLDHDICSHDFHNIITSMQVNYNVSIDDHLPVEFIMNINSMPAMENDFSYR